MSSLRDLCFRRVLCYNNVMPSALIFHIKPNLGKGKAPEGGTKTEIQIQEQCLMVFLAVLPWFPLWGQRGLLLIAKLAP
jgi:hypothetical protein